MQNLTQVDGFYHTVLFLLKLNIVHSLFIGPSVACYNGKPHFIVVTLSVFLPLPIIFACLNSQSSRRKPVPLHITKEQGKKSRGQHPSVWRK